MPRSSSYSVMLFAILVVLLASFSQAMYGPKSMVVSVDSEKSFKEEVQKYPGIVVVEFYAPWCGHCKNLEPEYEKAAGVLNGVVKLVAVDATGEKAGPLAQKFGVQGYPTIKVFGADKKVPVDYQGGRTSDAIVTESMKLTNKLVKDRKAGKTKTSSGGSDAKPKAKKSKGGSDVVTLTDNNFDKLVMQSNDHWMVEFYAPWCGHCKNLAPEWENAATQLKSQNVKLGAIDATSETNLAQRYEIQGFPSIKLFSAGGKDKAVDYNGPREADGIVQYALSTLESANVPVVIKQISSNADFEESTMTKLTAVLFLPHILDSQAKGREAYLATFEEVAKSFRKMPFSFSWTEANAQTDLENALQINGNFPTLAVISMEKKIYAVNKLSWNAKNIKAFMNGVLSGTEKTSSFEVPKLITVQPWDGKDGALEVEEYPLDELDL